MCVSSPLICRQTCAAFQNLNCPKSFSMFKKGTCLPLKTFSTPPLLSQASSPHRNLIFDEAHIMNQTLDHLEHNPRLKYELKQRFTLYHLPGAALRAVANFELKKLSDALEAGAASGENRV